MSEREEKIKIKHTLRTLTTQNTSNPLQFLALNKHQVGVAPVQAKLGRGWARSEAFSTGYSLPPGNNSMAKKKWDAVAGRKRVLGSFARLAPLRTS